MKSDIIRSVYRHWNDLRGHRVAPDRMAISPQIFAQFLPDIFLLNGKSEQFSVRLAGSRLSQTLGTKLTGKPFQNLFQKQHESDIEDLLEQVINAVAPLICSVKLVHLDRENDQIFLSRFEQKDEVSGEMLLLPLRHEGRFNLRLMGAISLYDALRYQAQSSHVLQITGHRFMGVYAQPYASGAFGSHISQTPILLRRGPLCLLDIAKCE